MQKNLRKQRRDPQEVYTWKIPWKLRDELQLVFYPGTVLPTSVAEHDNVPWFSGPRMRQPRFMLSAELGQKMGYDTQQLHSPVSAHDGGREPASAHVGGP